MTRIFMNKLAFLFLIYDIINHESIWHSYFHNFEGIGKHRYNIYIHYKADTDVRLEFFDDYKIDKGKIIDTKYADISIVKAHNRLIHEALKDAKNTHFIFLSGSCIPLKSFEYLYHHLDTAYSYFHVADPDDCFPDCEVALQYIPKRHIKKASQWSILNRKHGALLVGSDSSDPPNTYLRWFEDTYAPDELCYISYLSYVYNNTLDDEIIATSYDSPPEVATTFANWEDMNYTFVSERELKNYKSISEEELEHLLRSKSLFGRKFKPSCFPSLNKRFYYETISSG